jgi:glycosyltransferase involved in cell wall biosynthesis
MYISWIIPAHNEEKRIEKAVYEVDAYLKSRSFPGGYEIIVSNSASSDRTPDIVARLGRDVRNLSLLNVQRRGKGLAVKHGMLQARGDIRLFSDADNSTQPAYFDDMIPFFVAGCDVVISSRHPRDAAGASRGATEPWYRHLSAPLGNVVIRAVGVPGIRDTQNGFKALNAGAAKAIFSRSRIEGFGFDVEVLALARMLGYRIGIIPVHWAFDPYSTVTFAALPEMLAEVFRIRWNLTRGRYDPTPDVNR